LVLGHWDFSEGLNVAENSKIEWTDHTFNPWRGCTKIAAGCANCYADRQSKRNPKTLGVWGDHGTRVVASEAMWSEPLKWNKEAGNVTVVDADGCRVLKRPRVFCASLADVFEDWQKPMFILGSDPAVEGPALMRMDDVRHRLFRLIDRTPHLDWLLLTKRPQNIKAMWPDYELGRWDSTGRNLPLNHFRKNVWLGTSVANQEDADRNIPELLKCRDLSPVLFVSAEPLLGPVSMKLGEYAPNFAHVQERGFSGLPDWVICGGESGPNARPIHPDWARSLRDQCHAAGVPFFFNQWGEYCFWSQATQEVADKLGSHADGPIKLGKVAAGRLLDGREWNELPTAFRFPLSALS
jgi:protein gp37